MKHFFYLIISLCVAQLTSAQTNHDNLTFSHQHQVLFENNSFSLNDNESSRLTKCIDSLSKIDIKYIYLEGHTNSIGNTSSNQLLSEKRVESVKEYFKANKDAKITSNAYGETKPMYSNKTEKGLAANRQVVVKFGNRVRMLTIEGTVKDSIKALKGVKVYVKNKTTNDSLITDKNGKFKYSASEGTALTFSTNEKNYFNPSILFTPEENKKNEVFLELAQFAVNKEINLSSILFYSNKNVVRSGVEDVLESLTQNFLKNQDQCFEIQGHVNGQETSLEFTRYYKDLSEARAGTVYFYMKDHGVASGRMVPAGYSNTKMLYPVNPNFEQIMQNMRVVMKLLPCDEVKQKRKTFNEDAFYRMTKNPYYNTLNEATIKK